MLYIVYFSFFLFFLQSNNNSNCFVQCLHVTLCRNNEKIASTIHNTYNRLSDRNEIFVVGHDKKEHQTNMSKWFRFENCQQNP